MTLPPKFVSDADFLVATQRALDENKDVKIKIAIIDHIISVPHVIVPIAALTEVWLSC